MLLTGHTRDAGPQCMEYLESRSNVDRASRNSRSGPAWSQSRYGTGSLGTNDGKKCSWDSGMLIHRKLRWGSRFHQSHPVFAAWRTLAQPQGLSPAFRSRSARCGGTTGPQYPFSSPRKRLPSRRSFCHLRKAFQTLSLSRSRHDASQFDEPVRPSGFRHAESVHPGFPI